MTSMETRRTETALSTRIVDPARRLIRRTASGPSIAASLKGFHHVLFPAKAACPPNTSPTSRSPASRGAHAANVQLEGVHALGMSFCVAAATEAGNQICFSVPVFGKYCVTSPIPHPAGRRAQGLRRDLRLVHPHGPEGDDLPQRQRHLYGRALGFLLSHPRFRLPSIDKLKEHKP